MVHIYFILCFPRSWCIVCQVGTSSCRHRLWGQPLWWIPRWNVKKTTKVTQGPFNYVSCILWPMNYELPSSTFMVLPTCLSFVSTSRLFRGIRPLLCRGKVKSEMQPKRSLSITSSHTLLLTLHRGRTWPRCQANIPLRLGSSRLIRLGATKCQREKRHTVDEGTRLCLVRECQG